jgi:catechol 2,3-dioxygenase-like lactoylglutathione lyase family enzyme
MELSFCRAILFAKDMERMVEFYRDALGIRGGDLESARRRLIDKCAVEVTPESADQAADAGRRDFTDPEGNVLQISKV